MRMLGMMMVQCFIIRFDKRDELGKRREEETPKAREEGLTRLRRGTKFKLH